MRARFDADAMRCGSGRGCADVHRARVLMGVGSGFLIPIGAGRAVGRRADLRLEFPPRITP